MKKIILIGPKSLTHSVVQTLQEVGTVHLTQSEGMHKHASHDKSASDETLSKELLAVEKTHAKLDTLIALLPKTKHVSEAKFVSADSETWLNDLSKQCHDLSQQIQMYSDELTVLHAYQGAVKTLAPLLEPLQNSKNFEAIGFIHPKKEIHLLQQYEAELNKSFPDKVMIFRRSIDHDQIGWVLAYPKTQTSPIRSMLSRYGLNELKLPSSMSSIPLQDAVSLMERRTHEIPNALSQLRLQLDKFSLDYYATLKNMKHQIENQITALRTMKGLGQTQKTFMVSGFNPEKDIPLLQQKLKERFQDAVHMDVQACHEAPTLLDNNRLVRPFELFIKVLRPPKYGSIDPTPFFAFFFPIFFGLIMGDMGYGIIFLALGIFLKLKRTHEMLSHIGHIVIICSIYTIIFGFVFGEFFGDWLEKLGVIHPLSMQIGSIHVEWNRMHSLLPLLILAVGIGVVHVMLGFILKLIQSIKHRHHHEVIEVIAIMIALIGLFAFIGVLAQKIPAVVKLPSAIAVLICVPLLIFMKGPMMIMELLSFVGNMLSYARLMAVGVASAYLAFVGNMLGGLVGNLVLGAIIAILFHIINMVLAFSPTIQSARLHYVEFFSKFYETGGVLYQPLSNNRKS